MPGTQELDVYRSDDFEEDIEKEGFHISPLGALAISVCFMMLIPIILYPEKTLLMELIWVLFIIGFAAMKNAEVPTVLQFETTTDALWWAIPLGAVIAVVEVWVADMSINMVTNIPIQPLDMVLFVITVGAVSEELLYRAGVYLPARQFLVKAGLPTSVAVAIALPFQALLFSLGHMFVYETWDIFLALFVGGLMYGAAFEYKKDLTIPIIAHLTVNLSGFRETAVEYLMANPMLIALIILITLAFIIIKTRVA